MGKREKLNEKLAEAARKGDAAEVRRLLADGADVNARDEKYGRTPLMWAARVDRYDEFVAAGEAGEDMDAHKADGFRTMLAAASKRHAETARLLLDAGAGAEINARDASGRMSPLDFAVWSAASAELAKLLVDAGADVNATGSRCQTPLMGAAYRGKADVVELLLDTGADVKARSRAGWTALLYAVEGKAGPEVLKTLIRRGVVLEERDNLHRATALSYAVLLCNDEALNTLVDCGAEVDARARGGRTALMWAARRGDADPARALIRGCADVNAKDHHARTALMYAVTKDAMDTAKALALAGADVDYAADMLRRKGHGPETLGRLFALGAFAPDAEAIARCCEDALKRLARAQSGADETTALRRALQGLRR